MTFRGGGDVEEGTATFKEEVSNIMSEGSFALHKWHSNVELLNSVEKVTEGEETYAKSQVGNRGNEEHDTLSIDFKTCLKVDKPLTKRKMISVINSIYDVLGWSSPVTITANKKEHTWRLEPPAKCKKLFPIEVAGINED